MNSKISLYISIVAFLDVVLFYFLHIFYLVATFVFVGVLQVFLFCWVNHMFDSLFFWYKVKPRKTSYKNGRWVTEILKNGVWVEDKEYETWLKTVRVPH